MALGKEELLAAIAAAGTQGKAAYDQAQAQIAAQQQDAIRLALAGGLAQNAPAGAQAEIQRIISQGYQGREASLAAQNAAMQDYYGRLSANSNQFLTQAEGLIPALERQYALEHQGGGGSGGGGGGGGGSDQMDWYDNLKSAFGTAALGFKAVAAEAKNSYSWKDTHMSPHEYAQKYAEEQYGIPAGVAQSQFTQPKDEQKFQSAISGAVSGVKNRKQARKVISQARAQAKTLPGNQHYLVSQVRQQAKARVQARRRRRK